MDNKEMMERVKKAENLYNQAIENPELSQCIRKDSIDMMFDIIAEYFGFTTVEKNVRYPQDPRRKYHLSMAHYGGRFEDIDIEQLFGYVFDAVSMKGKYTIEERPRMAAIMFKKCAYFSMGNLLIKVPQMN